MESIGGDLKEMKRVPLAPDHVDAICAIGGERSYKAGEIIARTGSPTDRFVYVIEGEIEVADPYTGQRAVDSTLGPTQFMGDLAFLNGGSITMDMRAAQDTRTIEAPREAMLALMSRVPELSDHVISVFLARRRRMVEERHSAITLIGIDRCPFVQRIGSFLNRNRIPFRSCDIEATDPESLRLRGLTGDAPGVVFSRDQRIEDPTPRKVAQLLGMDLDVCRDSDVDVLIVGGGPAGVAAAVYAGAEGLSALVIEDTAIGGQAGTSSRIENYMGFPTGISGGDLIYRGQIQALKFGTRFAMPRRVEALTKRDDGLFCATMDEGDQICARAVLVATGVQYRRLPLDRLEALEGAGIFYAATEMEARFCSNTDAVIIGGGNSAGQAAMYLSRIARHVHVVVRGESLAASMSSYLTQRLEADPRITIHYRTQVDALHGEDYLEALDLDCGGEKQRLDCGALFIMVGAAPNTDWLSGLVELDDKGFVLTGAAVGEDSPYQTSHPGIFAVGDVRSGSVKRVASSVGEGSVVVSAIWQHVHDAFGIGGEEAPRA